MSAPCNFLSISMFVITKAKSRTLRELAYILSDYVYSVLYPSIRNDGKDGRVNDTQSFDAMHIQTTVHNTILHSLMNPAGAAWVCDSSFNQPDISTRFNGGPALHTIARTNSFMYPIFHRSVIISWYWLRILCFDLVPYSVTV